ncbi:MAG: hypothetical protein F6J94_18635 [Moorea sp. SIO1F2]|uniref:hypothetical protein n=1 Tax=Moorena sp. SIO1F2 TaxID=2607819 RepID=UPI0013B69A85|nr:hypothetical protein [Moorena sp. SIO1F2]NET83865.1 hypothetical protein [Moorena sp. SIO1F2]
MATLREQPVNFKPLNLGLWPRYANNCLTLAYWPRFANNLQPINLGLLATLREQPSTD